MVHIASFDVFSEVKNEIGNTGILYMPEHVLQVRLDKSSTVS